ncbi:MAG TPA: cytochrome c [Balneolaceae bacterium]|nr:cytochrome c [Balneolaceae bacterium]
MKTRLALLYITLMMLPILAQAQDTSWKAPDAADTMQNQFALNKQFLSLGEKTFKSNCTTCHGKKGKGNGPAAVALNPKPANLQSDRVQNESQGALFWKISTGKKGMPSWKSALSKKQLWAVVIYVKNLTKSKEQILSKN